MLQADSEEMVIAWINALQKGIGAAIQHDNNPPKGVMTNQIMGTPRHRQTHKKIHWEQFLKIPGNSKCCDCGRSDPSWASINLGITLCIGMIELKNFSLFFL